MKIDTPPRWDLSNVFPGLESEQFRTAFQDYQQQINQLEQKFTQLTEGIGLDTGEPVSVDGAVR